MTRYIQLIDARATSGGSPAQEEGDDLLCESFQAVFEVWEDHSSISTQAYLRRTTRPVTIWRKSTSKAIASGDRLTAAMLADGRWVEFGDDVDICSAICECDTLAESELCITCCGRCNIEADAITNFSATVAGVDWSQDGDSYYRFADKCHWVIPMRSTADDTANAYVDLVQLATIWTVDVGELGGTLPAGTDPASDPCNGSFTFDNLVNATGSFSATGSVVPKCSCCGQTGPLPKQIGCKFGADPISNFSGTSFATGQPVTQVGASVQLTPCSWQIVDNEGTLWGIEMDLDGYFRANEQNGLVYGGAESRVDQQACNGLVILRDQAGSQTVQFTSTAWEEGCNAVS